ncbi:7681_t:CDS:1, partial [Scutellospora calospora]
MYQKFSLPIDFPLDFNLPNKEAPEECDVNQQSVIVNLFSGRKPVCLHFPTAACIKIFDLKQIIFNRMLIDPEEQQYYTLAGKWLGDSIQVFESEDV